jgi:FkbM family methyltransferase
MRTATLAAVLDGPVRLFDIGARGGIDPRWDRFHPILDVLGFEPDTEECERLNLSAAQLPYRSRFIPFALGSEDREVTFNVCRWPVASSVFEPNLDFLSDFPHAAGLMAVVERRTIRTMPLDAISGRELIAPDCLKIDVEGAELDVLRGAEDTLAEALVLDVEVELNPLFRDQPLFGDVDAHLRERGWRLLGLRRVAWRRTAGFEPGGAGYGGQLVAGDALYYNHAAVAAGLPASRALKLAVILAAYRQSDFALAVLRRLDGAALTSHRRALQSAIVESPSLAQRVVSRTLRRLDSQHRRRLADAPQPGDATVWQDAHHF